MKLLVTKLPQTKRLTEPQKYKDQIREDGNRMTEKTCYVYCITFCSEAYSNGDSVSGLFLRAGCYLVQRLPVFPTGKHNMFHICSEFQLYLLLCRAFGRLLK